MDPESNISSYSLSENLKVTVCGESENSEAWSLCFKMCISVIPTLQSNALLIRYIPLHHCNLFFSKYFLTFFYFNCACNQTVPHISSRNCVWGRSCSVKSPGQSNFLFKSQPVDSMSALALQGSGLI